MDKNQIIIELVKDHFSYTFEGDTAENRAIIFTKQNFRSTPILMTALCESDIENVKK